MNKIMKNTSRNHSRIFLVALCVSVGLIIQSPVATAAPIPITPIVSGVFTNGDGVNSHWVQVQNDWEGPSTFSQDFGGIATLEDANVALGLSSGDAGFLRSTSGVMSNINAGNDLYNQLYAGTWGAAGMPPLFNTGDPNQENYAGHMWGYIAVPTAGEYNFGVLYDDGFAFTIWGANNTSLSMDSNDLSPRQRLGFDTNLAMEAGLYRFDLVGYNRLEAGVLNLGWWYGPTTTDFAIIPQDNLFTSAVPIPAAVWLFGSGLLGLIGVARRKQVLVSGG
ncbi:MAG: hypothetical protein Tsb0026_13720 [Sulfuricaulis sp.]